MAYLGRVKTWSAWALGALLLALPGAGHANAADNAYTTQLNAVLPKAVEEAGAPGAGVIVVSATEILVLAVAGVTSTETKVPLRQDSLWHIGSMTKAMTAEAILRAVETPEALLNSPLHTLAPDLALSFPADGITLDHLLSHRAGIARDVPADAWKGIEQHASINAQRRAYAEAASLSPDNALGSFSYSNVGYGLAAVAIESHLNTSWEALVTKHVFKRLSLTSAGFLAPGFPGDSSDESTVNRGHVLEEGWFWWEEDHFQPVPNDARGDNPAAMAPAGGVHLSLGDMGRFLQSHLQGLTSADPFYAPLHSARDEEGDYGLGWIIRDGIHFHSGSNRRWLSEMYLYPSENIAFSIHLNHGDPKSGLALIDTLSAAIRDAHKAATGVVLSPMAFESNLGAQ